MFYIRRNLFHVPVDILNRHYIVQNFLIGNSKAGQLFLPTDVVLYYYPSFVQIPVTLKSENVLCLSYGQETKRTLPSPAALLVPGIPIKYLRSITF